MASAPAHRNTGNLQKSHYRPTVCLADWWLTKAENQLAVAGFTSHKKQAVRLFSSGPILKRYSVFNVETTDGVCVILDGFINKDRTLENGFPSDVFNYFVFGFPPSWKEYYEKFMGKENNFMKANLDRDLSSSEDILRTSTDPEYVESASVDRQPGSRNYWNNKVTGLNSLTDKIQPQFLGAGSDSYGFDQVPETPKQDKDMGKIKIRNKKAKNKASKSLDSPAAEDNQTDKTKNSSSKKAKASAVETRRKSARSIKEASHSGKEKVPSASPQLSSLNRSKSGRVLMPTLEFWRNQIPVYDMSGTITGIEQGAAVSVPQIGSYQRKIRKRKQRA